MHGTYLSVSSDPMKRSCIHLLEQSHLFWLEGGKGVFTKLTQPTNSSPRDTSVLQLFSKLMFLWLFATIFMGARFTQNGVLFSGVL